LLAPLAARAEAPNASDVLTKLHESNQKEIEMGRQAEKSGQSKEVKSFGKQLVNDHTAANAELQSIASRKGITLPMPSTADAQAKMNEMNNMTGADYDRRYISMMIDDHNTAISKFENDMLTLGLTKGELGKAI